MHYLAEKKYFDIKKIKQYHKSNLTLRYSITRAYKMLFAYYSVGVLQDHFFWEFELNVCDLILEHISHLADQLNANRNILADHYKVLTGEEGIAYMKDGHSADGAHWDADASCVKYLFRILNTQSDSKIIPLED